MINRRIIRCTACATTIQTRTAFGHGELQIHSFACPKCNMPIQYRLRLDQEKVTHEYDEKPLNASWDDAATSADFQRTFDPEILGRRDWQDSDDGPYSLSGPPFSHSPFMRACAAVRDMAALKQHQTEHNRALAAWSSLYRLLVHFGSGESRRFDDEWKRANGSLPPGLTPELRLTHLRASLVEWQSSVTADLRSEALLFFDRITAVQRRRPTEWRDFATVYAQSGRLRDSWHASVGIRNRYASAFRHVGAIMQLRLWRDQPKSLDDVVVYGKHFDDLKSLYVDTFEHLCRLSTVAMAAEGLLARGTTDVLTKKGSLTVWEYEDLPNANKSGHATKTGLPWTLPSHMDTALRNGIGHFQAHYDIVSDRVVCAKSDGPNIIRWDIPYAEFCQRVVALVSYLLEFDEYLFALVLANGCAI